MGPLDLRHRQHLTILHRWTTGCSEAVARKLKHHVPSLQGHFASDFAPDQQQLTNCKQHVTTDNCERCRGVASCHSHLDHADPLTSENARCQGGPTGKLGWGHHLERSRRPLRLGDRESRPPLAKQGDCIFDHQMLPNAFGNKKTYVFH